MRPVHLENYLALPDHSMDARIAAARAKLGATTVILGHHYQRDEVVRFADFTGDSYKLSKTAAATGAQYIVFCGVHFMAESADILAQNGQQVILPDLNAGCSMADMAEISQVEDCWDALERAGLADETIPVTYINSTAAIKAFCGEHGGLVCTSSSARKALEWAIRARQADSVSAGPAFGPQHGACDGDSAGRDGGLGSMGGADSGQLDLGRANEGPACREPHAAVEGPLRRASALSCRPMWTRCGPSIRGFK